MRLGSILFLVLLSLGSLCPALPAGAQQQEKPARIGVLSPFLGTDSSFPETVRQELKDLGFVEGRTIAFEYRTAETFDQLAILATELVRLGVDVIVTAGPQGVRAAKNATSAIPIVMGNVGDPVEQGFVASLAKPGGNVTGLSSLNTELSAKRLALLKETIPALSHVAVLREAVGEAATVRAAEAAARTLQVRLQILQVREADELPSAFSAMSMARVGGLEVLSGSMFTSQLQRLVALAGNSRVPTIFPDSRFVRAGGLMSYGPNVLDLYRRAAGYIDKILKGAKPGDLPVEQPTKFELVINLKTAKSLRLTIPQSVLIQADEVIQ